MRVLSPPPASVLDPATGAPRTGSFRGPLPRVELAGLGHGPLHRLLRRKRWIYLAITGERLFIGLALVDLGYAGNAFAFAWEPGREGFLIERSALALPGGCRLRDEPGAVSARFRGGRAEAELRLVRGAALTAHARLGGFALDASLDLTTARPALSAIGPVPGGVLDATEKHALLAVQGELRVGGRTLLLDGTTGGYDYTHGDLARRTRWRWGYLMGRAESGERVAVNLVEGFLGEHECAVWVDDELHPVGEGRFTFDAKRPLAPWRVGSVDGAVDLRFRPGAVHAEARNLLVVRSRFVQPVGAYEGTLEVGGRRLALATALGVAEDQDVVW